MRTAAQSKMPCRDSSFACGLISGQIAKVSGFFDSQLDCADSRLKPFLDYLKGRQGKMLRASFVLLSGRLFGPTSPLHIEIAAVVEMIHAATLLHDDVIDKAGRRRNRATANKLWGDNFAVLMGDYLLSRVLSSVASLERDDINRLLAEMAGKICCGEMLQNACRGNFNIGIGEYLDIIEKKTAVFFADCCRLGAMASNADEASIERLYQFGLNFGLAYQIIDDLADILGAACPEPACGELVEPVEGKNRTGKTAGRDLGSKTFTMPVIFAVNNLPQAEKNELLELLGARKQDFGRIVTILDSVKSFDWTKSQAIGYQQKAVAALDSCDSNPAALALKDLAVSAVHLPQ